MPVVLSLELISQDARSKEATYAFELNNYCEHAISVRLDELLPKGTSVQRGLSDRQRGIESDVRRECARLERLLKEYHKALCKQEHSKDGTGHTASGAHLRPRDVGFQPWWQSLTPFSIAGSALRAVGLGEQAKPRPGSDEEHARDLVPDLRDPKVVLQLAADLLKGPDDAGSRVSALEHACQMQVNRVKMLQESIEEDQTTVIVGAGSSLTRTYIISSHKHWFRLRQRVIRIEAHYAATPEAESHTAKESVKETESVTAVHTVAPLALPVTAFALLGALAALEIQVKDTPLDLEQALPTLILAAVVYNVYDLTDLRQKISGSLDWRGALVVGLMCGLLGGPTLAVMEGGFFKALGVDKTPSPSASPSLKSSDSPSGPALSPSPGAPPGAEPSATTVVPSETAAGILAP